MPSLDDLYELYCGAASELNASPRGSARRAERQEEADQLWMEYTGQGGGREIWHDTGIPWQYMDDFVEIRVGNTTGPIDRLRKLLNIPPAKVLTRLTTRTRGKTMPSSSAFSATTTCR